MNEHLTEQQLIDYQFKLADETVLDATRAHLGQCEECRQRLQKLIRKFAALDLLRGEIEVPEELLSRTIESATQNRGMGILPMCRRAILALQVIFFHGRDARATLQTPSQARPSRIIWLYRVPALGAVAAAVIAGAALLLVSHSGPDSRIVPTRAPGLPPQAAAPARVLEEQLAFNKDQPMPPVAEEVAQDELAPQAKSLPLKTPLAEAQPGATGGTVSRLRRTPTESLSAVGGPGNATLLSGIIEKKANREIGGPGIPEPVPLANGGQNARDTTPYGATTNALDAATVLAQAPEVAEPPPFAPASAIELVVLPRRENVQLTIYNGADLTLVRERRNLTLKPGWNWLQFMWANTLIDPTSLALEPLEHQDAVQVQQLVLPPRLRELGRWLIHSNVSGPVPFELTYFTSGLAWRAFYMGTLAQDEKTMRLEGYVRIANGSGEDYEEAQTRLVVGQVHLLDQIADLAKRQYPYSRPGTVIGEMMGMMGRSVVSLSEQDALRLVAELRDAGPKEIRKEGLSEYFLYTIEGTETIPNQWGKRLLSFATDDIPVTNSYKYDEERWGGQAIRFLSFANDPNHKLGTTPLPDGTVRVYGRADGEGHLSYVGAIDVKYIPVGEKIELNLGGDRLVEIKPVLMDCRTENHTFDNKGNVSGWDDVQTWKIEIANTRPLPADVEVTRGFGTPAWTLKQENQGVSYEKYDATHARLRTTVAPQSKRVFEYTVTMYRGSRQEIVAPQ